MSGNSITTTFDPSTLGSAYTSTGQTSETKAKSNDQVSKNQFLQLLVTQLKNQDPLNPMENDRVAVDLATFSQLEQLMSINEKIETPKDSASSFSSLASYLGTEVKLNSNDIQVKDGEGGRVSFTLPKGMPSGSIELLDSNGTVVGSTAISSRIEAGHRSFALNDLTVPNGTYTARLSGTSDTGAPVQILGSTSGIVTGFIPGTPPKLLMGDREIAPEDIVEVRTVS